MAAAGRGAGAAGAAAAAVPGRERASAGGASGPDAAHALPTPGAGEKSLRRLQNHEAHSGFSAPWDAVPAGTMAPSHQVGLRRSSQ